MRVFAILSVPSILAASTREKIAKTLIADKDTGNLGQTFQDLHKEHGDDDTSGALVEVTKRGHPEIVATCLRVEKDPFPNDKMCVSELVNTTLARISSSTRNDPESFANMIASFKPTDAKPLVAIRSVTLWGDDAINVLERVMAKSPELITDTLPSWLASHRFDRSSLWYKTSFEKAFQYLASFATESVLEKALSIVNKNEHYKRDFGDGPEVACCNSQYDFPQDLVDKLSALLELVKARNELVRSVLESFMPTVLLKLLAEYITYETA